MRSVFVHILFCLYLFGSPLQLAAAEKGNIYRHPAGLSFWYPDNWKLHELEEALQLVPNDVVSTVQGDSELYFVTGESIAGSGITRADDPQVIAYIDQQVRSMLPTLTLQKHSDRINLMGTEGIVFKWRGNNNDGKPVEGRAYVVISQNFALTLSAIALDGLINKRDTQLKKIFASFVIKEGKKDPALAGRWKKIATTSIRNSSVWETDWSRANMVADEETITTFNPDGTWHRLYTYHMIAGAGGVWLEDKDRKEYRGTWSADGKRLFMLFEDNSWDEFEYQIVKRGNGRELRLSDGKRGQIWKMQ